MRRNSGPLRLALHDLCGCPLPVQMLGLVYTFGSGQPGVQAIILTLLCIAYTVVHTMLAPMRSPVVGTAECLTKNGNRRLRLLLAKP